MAGKRGDQTTPAAETSRTTSGRLPSTGARAMRSSPSWRRRSLRGERGEAVSIPTDAGPSFCTGAMNRYPLPVTVCTKGCSGSSLRTC